jgi:hypothetical protein
MKNLIGGIIDLLQDCFCGMIDREFSILCIFGLLFAR